ncbi:hypothetical protein [Saccharomonospora saliphila]|uniref:hypothetical protein n=1 Tax=Saccharomonospora saliphila TaxID=369829 RepID=UPI0012FAA135|nr:hypothetical protein [Saccharomonospora saliphila]
MSESASTQVEGCVPAGQDVRHTAVAVDESTEFVVDEPSHSDQRLMVLVEVATVQGFVVGDAVAELAEQLDPPDELLPALFSRLVVPVRERLVQAGVPVPVLLERVARSCGDHVVRVRCRRTAYACSLPAEPGLFVARFRDVRLIQ